jgi:two-component system cell cycle sensor histidine kinase/response regulator CckA
MLEKYGSVAGFHRPLDEVVGLDTVAIPMNRISEILWPQFTTKLAMSVVGLGLLFLTTMFIIRTLILNRLLKIADHLSDAATQPGYNALQHLKIDGQDEINDIANGFNTLSDKLKQVYSSLEMQVVERTNVLETRNTELKEEIISRTEAQNSLKEQEATMRSIFRAAPTGIGMVSNRVFTQVNKKLCSMLGYSKEELIGQGSRLMYLTEKEYELAGETDSLETILRHKDGTPINVLLSSSPSNSNDLSAGITFTALDITAKKVAAKDKKYLEEKLGRSQKMEALGLLAGGVAHDLNNVLSGIVSYPDLILLELPDDSPLRRSIITMQESGKKAEAIVQDLLTLARRGVTHTEVLDLNKVLSDHIHSPEHKKMIGYFPDIKIIDNYEPELLNIRGSSIHLKKTIMNLISNAAEAIPKRGQIKLSTENRYVDTPLKGYDEVQAGDFVVLTVSDSGTGIAQDDLRHIFEPFYTKKVMGRSGTGLGMSVVWGTIQDHNGYLNVETAIGKGTTFELFFPVTRKTIDNYKQLIDLEDYLGNGEEILIIDDDSVQREIAGAMLNKLGYKISTAPNGEKGVEFLRNHPVDLVVLDMIMAPHIDGLETYRKIIKDTPGQKAIIASGFSETSRIKEAQRLGVGEYVKKPYTLERIGLAAKTALSSP